MNNDNNTILGFDVNLICDFFLNTERQGPGSPEVTLKALSFIDNLTDKSLIADLGCGTGGQTMILAQHAPGKITGIDFFPGFIERFNKNAEKLNLQNRVKGIVGSMDDLSFEEHEIEYKLLKAVIEGGMETKPDNVLIYATSNRRHLIRETWSDRSDKDEELHRSDTVQEKLSLAARFGVSINYSKPTQQEYFQIVTNLAKKYPEIKLSDKELCAEANKWELSHGGISGRTAQQFINYIAGKSEK